MYPECNRKKSESVFPVEICSKTELPLPHGYLLLGGGPESKAKPDNKPPDHVSFNRLVDLARKFYQNL